MTGNKGKNTPSVDKVTWKTPGAKINAIASLKRRGYSPLPLRSGIYSEEKQQGQVTHIKDGFDFRGWNIRKYDGKLLMKPSKANLKAHLDKIREIINANATAKQANVIRLLNPVLRGWANYHSHVVAKETFARVDANVWSMLWRWAARRHPSKGAG